MLLKTYNPYFLRNFRMLLVQEVSFAFSIYDQDGIGQLDAYLLGDLLRACNLNPTNSLIDKFGGAKKKGKFDGRSVGRA